MSMFLYYCVVFTILVIASPLLLVKAKARAGLSQKLGSIPADFNVQGQSVWFHAVSMGEFHAIKTLLRDFHEKHPHLPVVVSTTTATGQALAKETVGAWAQVVYMPFDLPWTVCAWFDRAKPSLVVISETEIWPGLAYQCKRRGIALVVVNGRISPRSFNSYKNYQFFFSSVLRNFSAFGVQAETEAERYRTLADSSDVDVRVLGNLKLDGLTAHSQAVTDELRQSLGLEKSTRVMVAGSTHEGEEAAVLDALLLARRKHPDLKLIIVPRHPERFDRAAEIIRKTGLSLSRYSQKENFANGADVLLIDAMGLLTKLYSVADVAFVGGSIAPIGGHNLMEPYLYKVPVICGPNIQKTRDTASQLEQKKALFIVSEPSGVGDKLCYLLDTESERLAMGERGNQFLLVSRGATQRALSFIEEFMQPSRPEPSSVKMPTVS